SPDIYRKTEAAQEIARDALAYLGIGDRGMIFQIVNIKSAVEVVAFVLEDARRPAAQRLLTERAVDPGPFPFHDAMPRYACEQAGNAETALHEGPHFLADRAPCRIDDDLERDRGALLLPRVPVGLDALLRVFHHEDAQPDADLRRGEANAAAEKSQSHDR